MASSSSSFHSSLDKGIESFRKKEYEKAVNYFYEELQKTKNLTSCLYLGIMHLRGHYFPTNLNIAEIYLDMASYADDIETQNGANRALSGIRLPEKLKRKRKPVPIRKYNSEADLKYHPDNFIQYLIEAVNGHIEAQFIVARLFSLGVKHPQDTANQKLAFYWFKKVTDTASYSKTYDPCLIAASKRALGSAYMLGCTVTQSDSVARRLFLESAREGDTLARYNVSTLLAEGRGGPKDLVQAAYWAKLAADSGDSQAEYFYAHLLLQGRGTKKDEKAALQYLKSSLNHGNFYALIAFASFYQTGHSIIGGSPNYELAADYCLRALSPSHPKTINRDALGFLGEMCYENQLSELTIQKAIASGKIIRESEFKEIVDSRFYGVISKELIPVFAAEICELTSRSLGVVCLLHAAKLGNLDAISYMGKRYTQESNYIEAEKYYTAHEIKDLLFQYDKADFYYKWYKAENNITHLQKAIEILENNAKENHSVSAHLLGFLYLTEEHCLDPEKAYFFYSKAVLGNIPTAQNTLSELYEQGVGCHENLDKALYWCEQATANKDAIALRRLPVLRSKVQEFKESKEKKESKEPTTIIVAEEKNSTPKKTRAPASTPVFDEGEQKKLAFLTWQKKLKESLDIMDIQCEGIRVASIEISKSLLGMEKESVEEKEIKGIDFGKIYEAGRKHLVKSRQRTQLKNVLQLSVVADEKILQEAKTLNNELEIAKIYLENSQKTIEKYLTALKARKERSSVSSSKTSRVRETLFSKQIDRHAKKEEIKLEIETERLERKKQKTLFRVEQEMKRVEREEKEKKEKKGQESKEPIYTLSPESYRKKERALLPSASVPKHEAKPRVLLKVFLNAAMQHMRYFILQLHEYDSYAESDPNREILVSALYRNIQRCIGALSLYCNGNDEKTSQSLGCMHLLMKKHGLMAAEIDKKILETARVLQKSLPTFMAEMKKDYLTESIFTEAQKNEFFSLCGITVLPSRWGRQEKSEAFAQDVTELLLYQSLAFFHQTDILISCTSDEVSHYLYEILFPKIIRLMSLAEKQRNASPSAGPQRIDIALRHALLTLFAELGSLALDDSSIHASDFRVTNRDVFQCLQYCRINIKNRENHRFVEDLNDDVIFAAYEKLKPCSSRATSTLSYSSSPVGVFSGHSMAGPIKKESVILPSCRR